MKTTFGNAAIFVFSGTFVLLFLYIVDAAGRVMGIRKRCICYKANLNFPIQWYFDAALLVFREVEVRNAFVMITGFLTLGIGCLIAEPETFALSITLRGMAWSLIVFYAVLSPLWYRAGHVQILFRQLTLEKTDKNYFSH